MSTTNNADSGGTKRQAVQKLISRLLVSGPKKGGRKKLGITMSDAMTRGHVKDSAGNQYEVMGSGAIRRTWVKPWKGKSERRKVIKGRRQIRVDMAGNHYKVTGVLGGSFHPSSCECIGCSTRHGE